METGKISLGITNYIGHFNQYHIVYTLCFTGYYVDDNAHFYGLVVSAGGRDSSWTSSGVSFLTINLG